MPEALLSYSTASSGSRFLILNSQNYAEAQLTNMETKFDSIGNYKVYKTLIATHDHSETTLLNATYGFSKTRVINLLIEGYRVS